MAPRGVADRWRASDQTGYGGRGAGDYRQWGVEMIHRPKHFHLGVFMPVGNNGWILSKSAPQYLPTYQLNKDVALLAERIGFDYIFSMAK